MEQRCNFSAVTSTSLQIVFATLQPYCNFNTTLSVCWVLTRFFILNTLMVAMAIDYYNLQVDKQVYICHKKKTIMKKNTRINLYMFT